MAYQVWLLYSEWDRNLPLPHGTDFCHLVHAVDFSPTFPQRVSDQSGNLILYARH